MKQGWEMKKLFEVVDFQRGLTYSKNDEVDFSDNIVLRSNNVDLKTNKLDFTELKYINPKINIHDSKKVSKGSLIICTANGSKSHLGKVALIDDDYDYAFGGFMGLITPKYNLNSNFLFHLMTSEEYKKFIGALSDGANINNLKFSDLGEFEIPLPPLPEQQRIVSILDEAFAAIVKAKANAEQNLKNAKELFESYLQGVFENKGVGWEENTLGEILVKTETVDPSKKPNEEFTYLDVSSVNKETKEIENVTVLLGKDAPSRARKLVRTNDVIFATVRPTHSRVALITEEFDEQVCSTGYFVMRAKSILNNNFIYYFLLTHSFNKEMERLQKGASYPAVTDSEVKSIIISYPKSKREQESIIQKLDVLNAETKRLEALYQQKINDLEELKKSVLQKAFSGELKTSKALV